MQSDQKPTSNGLPCEAERIDEFLSEPTERVMQVLERTQGPFLVLGAGGKMGRHLCLMLRLALDRLGRDDRVLAVSRFRTLRNRQSFERHGIETQACDLLNPDGLEQLPDAAVVFYLAGIKFDTEDSPDLLYRFNVQMPQQVARRFRSSRIVAFSSGCVYPFVSPLSGGATEATQPEPVGDYAASCIQRENAFSEASALHGNPVTLIRLNYSVEFRYGILLDIAQKILNRESIDVTTGYVNVIWQRDAVAKTIQSLELAASPPVPINITGDRIYKVRELAARLGDGLGASPTIVGTEAPTAWLTNPARSCELLGPPKTSIDEMVAWVSAWLSNDGTTWGKPTGYASRDGRF